MRLLALPPQSRWNADSVSFSVALFNILREVQLMYGESAIGEEGSLPVAALRSIVGEIFCTTNQNATATTMD